MTRPVRAVLGAAVVVAVLGLVVAGVVVWRGDDPGPAAAPAATTAPASPDCPLVPPDDLTVEVVRTAPHDPAAYTQGLVMSGDRLFESTGREGASTVREVDPATGEVLDSTDLAADEFGEGLTMTEDGRLVQLTWLDGTAHVWQPEDLTSVGSFDYEGEGWGLTTLEDGTLAMSDGSGALTLRDPDDFAVLDRREVQRVGGPVDQLNELEWDGEVLWANRYQTDELVRIDPVCATVTGVADLSALREDAAAAAAAAGTPIDVTNGIAHVPGTDRYLVTGKWWPTMYEVRIG